MAKKKKKIVRFTKEYVDMLIEEHKGRYASDKAYRDKMADVLVEFGLSMNVFEYSRIEWVGIYSKIFKERFKL